MRLTVLLKISSLINALTSDASLGLLLIRKWILIGEFMTQREETDFAIFGSFMNEGAGGFQPLG